MNIAGLGANAAIGVSERKKEEQGGNGFAAILASLNDTRFEKAAKEKAEAASTLAGAKKPDAAAEFLDFMNKPHAERMQEMWLKRHGISKEEFEAMDPAEREKLLAKMRAELDEQVKQSTKAKLDKAAQFLV